MISTKRCVICFGEARYFGGHVHKGEEHVIAGTCEEHHKQMEKGLEGCKGCYGEWREKMGYNDPNAGRVITYGTDKSELLKEVIAAGHKPIAITVMLCEETFVFRTKAEADAAADEFLPEGWWYAIEDKGEWPWEKAWKDYVEKFYDGDEKEAPEIYWLDEKIKTVKEWKSSQTNQE